MQHAVVVSDGSESHDEVVAEAATLVGPTGALAVITVLSGSLVARITPPADRGRRRRELEDEASYRLQRQLARVGVTCEARAVALFGDVVDDALLLATNLGVDAVVIASTSPHLERLRESAPMPVRAVGQADAPA